jgi:hypothetical protein
MLKEKNPGGVRKKSLHVTVAGKSSYSAGTVPAAFRFVPPVLRKTSGA